MPSASGEPGSGGGLRASLDRLLEGAEGAEASELPAAAPAVYWPSVDWSRYNLQLLFVDKTGTVRSRFAAGIFERIAEWNGWSRAIMPASCGLQPAAHEGDTISRTAAILTAGSHLGLFTRGLARPAEMFDAECDLDFYDLVLVLDRGLHEEIMAQIPQEHTEYYKKKVCLLTCFSDYESEGIMLARGGLALLPGQLSWILQQGFTGSKTVVDVPSPTFSSESSEEEWSAMVRVLILACGGLCKYLMDSFPEDMPEYDPID